MEGAALKAEREHDLAISQAWHTAIFALNGYGGKLNGKSLSDYIGRKEAAKPSPLAGAVAFFGYMKAAGMPIEVTRTERASMH